MSAISPLRVFKAQFRLFIDISKPLLKCFVKEWYCLFRFAIPRMSCFQFCQSSLPFPVYSFHIIALDEMQRMDDSRNGETEIAQSTLEFHI